MSMHLLWGPGKVFGKLWGQANQLQTSTKVADYYRTWLVPTRLTQLTASHRQTFGSTWVSSPILYVLTMTIQECYNRSLQDQSQQFILADVLHKSVSPYRLSSRLLHGWSNTILHHCLAILVVRYFLFIFIGSPPPVPATYARTTDTKWSGFCHR